jgi:hypothetical protein
MHCGRMNQANGTDARRTTHHYIRRSISHRLDSRLCSCLVNYKLEAQRPFALNVCVQMYGADLLERPPSVQPPPQGGYVTGDLGCHQTVLGRTTLLLVNIVAAHFKNQAHS